MINIYEKFRKNIHKLVEFLYSNMQINERRIHIKIYKKIF
jgi:hypothetical protein